MTKTLENTKTIFRYWFRTHLGAHTKTHSHRFSFFWNGNTLYSPMNPQSTCSRQEKKKEAIVCMCVQCIAVNARSPSPWVTETWLRQNWNESTTKHFCNVHRRGLTLSFWCSWQRRENVVPWAKYWEGWKHKDKELWYFGALLFTVFSEKRKINKTEREREEKWH